MVHSHIKIVKNENRINQMKGVQTMSPTRDGQKKNETPTSKKEAYKITHPKDQVTTFHSLEDLKVI
jgi:hypothetical protein